MENNREYHIGKTDFDAFVHAVGSEIEQAQVRLITAANAQMLFHYWKMGNYILYHQNLQGWGSKIIKQLAKAIRFNYPEKKVKAFGGITAHITVATIMVHGFTKIVQQDTPPTDIRFSILLHPV